MRTMWVIIVVAVGAFFLGRASKVQKEKITYVKGKEVAGNVSVGFPKKEIMPSNPILPYKYIFIEGKETEVVDSAKIVREYSVKRTYDLTLFDNLSGKLDLQPTLQYNRLVDVPYTFTPMTQKITTENLWAFFVSTSWNTFSIAGVGGGVFYKNLGVEYKYLRQVSTGMDGHEVGIKYKF